MKCAHCHEPIVSDGYEDYVHEETFKYVCASGKSCATPGPVK